MGCCVLLPGNAAQLRGQRIWCLERIVVRRLVIPLVKIFRHVSKSVMGLVLSRLFSYAVVLGMG